MASAVKVLVVEDERDVRDLICLHLKREGIAAEVTENGEEALDRALKSPYDLLVLDWMLPGLSGLEICRKLRAAGGRVGRVPILMVTARADTADIVVGLEAGADDYLTKPFEIPELLARVRSLLRRAKTLNETGPAKVLEVGGLRVDLDSHEVRCHSDEVHLTPSEFRLLTALLENRGRVLARDQLISLVQGEGVTVVDRAIDTHVFGLRKKLGACAEVIETVRGIGYRVRG